jgi:hypothetical protein
MGRLTRRIGAVVAGAGSLALLATLAFAEPTAAFDGFGESQASSAYGEEMRFSVELRGDAPDRLELLLTTPESEGDFVAPVTPTGGRGTYIWDTSVGHVTPNTPVTYRWRAVTGDEVVVSDEMTHRYVDDRSGLDWQTAQLGEATVHWYGGAEAQARRFGELTAVGVDRAAQLLGTQLAGPVDIFVYASEEDFFGALGPGAREWTGAAAFPELRTVFMYLGGGSESYLEIAILHEVTHVVFFDATDNPYHEPARWLNEGIATWAETSEAGGERGVVELEAGGGGLLAFPAITAQFPIDERAARLAYAQGTVMIDLIVERFGTEALAGIAAAYRAGATDEQALEAGTGVPAEELYADFFATFGAEPPGPVEPEPILPSNVERPPGAQSGGGPDATPPPDAAPNNEPVEEPSESPLPVLLIMAGGVAAAIATVVALRRRAAASDQGDPGGGR